MMAKRPARRTLRRPAGTREPSSGKRSTRLRRWRRRLAMLAVVATCLLSVAWLALVSVIEGAAPLAGPPVPNSGAAVADPRYFPAIKEAHRHIQAMMAERRIPGLSVAVAKDGALVWSEGFGYADRERKALVSRSTRFRICSVSKLLTAAGMARLYEQGRLDLDAPIQRYVPGFPEKGFPITARQLASHRSGIRGYRDDTEALNTKHYRSVTESLEKFQEDPLAFRPDTGFQYSGYGYVLLSAAMEGAAAEEFLSFMRRQVFEPLGMSHTCEDRVSPAVPDRSRFYDIVTPYSDGRRLQPSPFIDFSCKWAAGGFLSTAEDLVRFGSAHMAPMNEGFLRRETLDLLFTPRTRQAGIFGHGLGWMTLRDLHLRRMCFHTGAGSGGTSVLSLYPEQRVCVAMLANLGHAKFPMPRLMGIAYPFLADPAKWIFGTLAFCSLGTGIVHIARWIPGKIRPAGHVGTRASTS